MQEFTSVSASSYDPAALAAKLTEKSAEGWSVVSIVPTGGDVTAFLSREATADTAASASVAAAAAQPAAAAEPAGWAVAPEAANPTPAVVTPEPAVVTPEPAVVTPAPAAQQPAAQAATPSVPAGWYADPAGRFELRYWDGDKWTEHVSRAGQQYTDPPVA